MTESKAYWEFPESLKQEILHLELGAMRDGPSYHVWRGIQLALKHLGIPLPDEMYGTVEPNNIINAGDVKQVIIVRKDLNMVLGKESAQVAHASGAFVFSQLRGQKGPNFRVKLTLAEQEWIKHSYSKIVVVVDSEDELKEVEEQARKKGLRVHCIIDSGRTQFHNKPTFTCLSVGPDYSVNIDPVTGGLRLR